MGQESSQPVQVDDIDDSSYAASTEHKPSVADVLRVKTYLQSKLPPELVDGIIDDASYWPHSSVNFERPFTLPFFKDGRRVGDAMYMRTLPLGIRGTEGDFSFTEQDFMNGPSWLKKLRLGGPDDLSWSTPSLSYPCRKIEFQLWSHDQGWGGEHPGTYNASFTWFDTGIDKLPTPTFASDVVEWPSYLLRREDVDDAEAFRIQRDTTIPVIPLETTLQKNVAAKRQTTVHTIVWHFLDSFDKDSAEAKEAANMGRGPGTLDGKFVRRLQVGDCITLWVRARFPGWQNHVQKAEITVYWAV
ncbi:hypothetical protein K503DRAFT_748708 [Rhizopogon vinicolor AM-OR11-026]|uniref:Uncharacterized protein n=1 Tax=Rhizopogon vinicolor AM-OR11-026 TaxID=1314800 RepID=A0A1B7MLJ8_9AGAM|nr:hypothetical protein K503DRAFT_748708 [Rhizopogon vinicolor AM-OR11-026]